MHLKTLASLAVALAMGSTLSARAADLFDDNFNAGASPLWSNTRGNWSAAGGVYNATSPTFSPPLTYSGLPFVLGDLSFDVDINQVGDGGIWLHSDATGANGVVLVTGGNGFGAGNTGGQTGKQLYFQIMQNSSLGAILNPVSDVFTNPGVQNTHVHITVVGNVYTATAEGKTATLTTSLFPTGRVGLYDGSIQTFDNVALVPEPASLTMLGAASLLLAFKRTRRSSN